MPTWWPFGRRRRKNKSDNAADSQREKTATRDQAASPLLDEKRPRPPTPPARNPARVAGGRRASSPTARSPLAEKNVLYPSQSLPQTANTSDFPTQNTSVEDITALPSTLTTTPKKVTQSSKPKSPDASERRPPPSLHSKRSATHLMRKKSSKKHKDRHERESQIKAISSPIPIPKRTTAEARIRAALQDESAVSLTRPGSTRSSMTALSDNQYQVGGVDVFSPRPTIRHSIHNAQSATASRAVSRTENPFDQELSPRRVMKESRTIDDLADSYDANTLRELMERDQRRRDRKRKAQEERARKRLEKYAEGAEAGPSNRKDKSRAKSRDKREKDDDDDDTGLGLTGVEAGPSTPLKGRGPVKETEDLSRRNPFADGESEVTTPLEELAAINTAQEIRYSQVSASPTSPTPPLHSRKRSNISTTTDPRSASNTNIAEPVANLDRRASETSNRRGGPLAALFRRGGAAKRQASDPDVVPSEPSFSNTSRESMSRQVPPAHLRERPSVPAVRSGTPTRTMSKFREDLPESLSVAPPESLTQTPEAAEPPSGTLLSARQREKMPESGPGGEERPPSPSVGVLSQSLASVDSEGSWLSGRPPKRTSIQTTGLAIAEERASRNHMSADLTALPTFERSAPARQQQGASGIAAALTEKTGQAEAGQSEATERMGEVARRPTLAQAPRAQSSEGLLRQFNADASESAAVSPIEGTAAAAAAAAAGGETSPVSPVHTAETESSSGHESEGGGVVVVAATSKTVLGHARSVSRGSAKLLDITRKGSATATAEAGSAEAAPAVVEEKEPELPVAAGPGPAEPTHEERTATTTTTTTAKSTTSEHGSDDPFGGVD